MSKTHAPKPRRRPAAPSAPPPSTLSAAAALRAVLSEHLALSLTLGDITENAPDAYAQLIEAIDREGRDPRMVPDARAAAIKRITKALPAKLQRVWLDIDADNGHRQWLEGVAGFRLGVAVERMLREGVR
jgi:hypothetical protein